MFFILLFVCGCGRYDMYSAADVYSGKGLYCEAVVTVHSDIDFEYTVSYALDKDTDRVLVLEPEQIQGLCYDFKKSAFGIEDTMLSTSLPFVEGYTPCDCLRGAFKALSDKAPRAYALETTDGVKTAILTYDEPDGIHGMSICLERKTGRFIYAAFYEKGTMILEARATTFYILNENEG